MSNTLVQVYLNYDLRLDTRLLDRIHGGITCLGDKVPLEQSYNHRLIHGVHYRSNRTECEGKPIRT